MNAENAEQFYNKNYKKLIFIPVIILAMALFAIISQYNSTGEFFYKDVSLKGGISARIDTSQEFTEEQIQDALKTSAETRKIADLATGERLGYIIQTSELTPEQLKDNLNNNLNLNLVQGKNFSYEETGPKLGQAFYKQLIIALIFAFVLMGVTVLITFRTIIPSIAIMSAALMDISITLAILNFLRVEISTAGIIAFLLVIGYSVDTDVLLTNWALRKKDGALFSRFVKSMKTGLTMSVTTITAVSVALIFTTAEIIREMFLIILIALVVDVFATYLTNMGILKWYCAKKGIR